MYLRSSGRGPNDHGGRYWGRATGIFDRALLVIGALALLLVVTVLWIWLVYGSDLGTGGVYATGIGLCALTAGIGFAMIRILDGR